MTSLIERGGREVSKEQLYRESHPGEEISDEVIAGLDARKEVNQTLSRLRKRLGSEGIIKTHKINRYHALYSLDIPPEELEQVDRERIIEWRASLIQTTDTIKGTIALDKATHCLRIPSIKDQQVITLSPHALKTMALLMDHIGEVVPYEVLMDALYDESSDVKNSRELLKYVLIDLRSRIGEEVSSELFELVTGEGLGLYPERKIFERIPYVEL